MYARVIFQNSVFSLLSIHALLVSEIILQVLPNLINAAGYTTLAAGATP
jgi:hypothetical protein